MVLWKMRLMTHDALSHCMGAKMITEERAVTVDAIFNIKLISIDLIQINIITSTLMHIKLIQYIHNIQPTMFCIIEIFNFIHSIIRTNNRFCTFVLTSCISMAHHSEPELFQHTQSKSGSLSFYIL